MSANHLIPKTASPQQLSFINNWDDADQPREKQPPPILPTTVGDVNNSAAGNLEPVAIVVPPIELSPVQTAALELHNAGMTVRPVPYSSKAPTFGWQMHGRLYHNPDDVPRPYDLLDVFSGQVNLGVLTGKPSGNLFVLDCDDERTLDHIMRQFVARSIPLCVVRSPRGGHVWLRSRAGEVMTVPKSDRLRDLEIFGHDRLVMCPPSYRGDTATCYRWDAPTALADLPTIDLADLEGLTDRTGNVLPLRLHRRARTKPTRGLSSRTTIYLTTGANEGRRNTALFAAACDYNGNGISFATAADELAPVAAQTGLDRTEIDRVLENAYSKPRTAARTYATQPTAAAWQHAAHFADRHTWQGRTATTDRAVFTALIECAKYTNSDGSFTATTRQLADLAEFSRCAVMKALARLQSAGLVIAVRTNSSDDSSRNRKPSSWQFGELPTTPARPPACGAGSTGGTDELSIETNRSPNKTGKRYGLVCQFAFSTLRHYPALVFVALLSTDDEMTVSQLVTATGLSDRAVRRALKWLIEARLAVQFTGRPATFLSHPNMERRLQEIAADKTSAANRRRERYRREQGLYVGMRLFHARLRVDRDNIDPTSLFNRTEAYYTAHTRPITKTRYVSKHSANAPKRARTRK